MAREGSWGNVFEGSGGGGGSRRSTGRRSGGDARWDSVFGDGPPSSGGGSGGGKSLFDQAKSAVGDVVGGAANVALGGLQALDTGRRAVLAGGLELTDGFRALTGRETGSDLGGKIRQTGFSWEDFKRNTLDADKSVGFGEVIEEIAPDSNPWVKRFLGFAGDVVTDPLTYVTLGASSAAKGVAQGGTRLLNRKQVASRLLGMSDDQARAATGLADAAKARDGVRKFAGEVLEDGVGELTRDAADALGVRIGASVPIPFSGGNRAVIPGTAPLAKYVGRAGGKVRRNTWGRLSKRVSPETWAKLENIPGVSPIRRQLGEVSALEFSQSHYGAGNEAQAWAGRRLDDFGNIHQAHDGVNWGEVTRAIETGETALLPQAERAAANDLSGLLAKIRDDINAIDPDFQVPRLENYYPHVITDELRDLIGKGGQRGGRGVTGQGHAGKRRLKKGAEFLGHIIETDDVRSEARRISREVLGTSAVEVFIDDPRMVMAAYLQSMQKQYRNVAFLKRLQDAGLLKHVDRAELLKKAKAHKTYSERAAKARATVADVAERLKGRDAQVKKATRRLAENQAKREAVGGAVDQALSHDAVIDAMQAEIDATEEAVESLFADAQRLVNSESPVVDRTPLDDATRARQLAEQAVDARQARVAALDDELAGLQQSTPDTPGGGGGMVDDAGPDLGALEGQVAAEEARLGGLQAERDRLVSMGDELPPPTAGVDLPLAEGELADLQAQRAANVAESRAVSTSASKMRMLQRLLDGESPTASLIKGAQYRGRAILSASDEVQSAAARVLPEAQFESLPIAEQVATARRAVDDAVPYEGRDQFRKELDRWEVDTRVRREAAESRDKVYGTASDIDYEAEIADLDRQIREGRKAVREGNLTRQELEALRDERSEWIRAKREGTVPEGGLASGGDFVDVQDLAPDVDALVQADEIERLYEKYVVAAENNNAATHVKDELQGLAERARKAARKGEQVEFTQAEYKELQRRIDAEEKLRKEVVASRKKIDDRIRQVEKEIEDLSSGPADAAMRKAATSGVRANERALTALEHEILAQQSAVSEARRALARAGKDQAARREATTAARQAKKRLRTVENMKARAEKALLRENEKLAKALKVEADEYERFGSLQTVARTSIDDQAAALSEVVEQIRARRGVSRRIAGEQAEMAARAEEILGEARQLLAEGDELTAELARLEVLEIQQRLRGTGAAWDAFYAERNIPANTLSPSEKELLQATAHSGADRQALKHWNLEVQDVMAGTLHKFAEDRNLWGSPEILDAIQMIDTLGKPDKVNGLIRAYDRVQSQWKAYALMSPGYHSRNFQTAVFMNALDGMATKRYGQFGLTWRRMSRAAKRGLDPEVEVIDKIKDERLREGMRAIWHGRHEIFDEQAHRAMEHVQHSVAGGRGVLGRGRLQAIDPTSMNNAAINFNFKMAGKTEKLARGPLALDALMRGDTWEQAMERVAKLHFDYSDLSHFEKKYMKRIIPFYTWTRKNLPVMMEMAAKKPGGLMWYLHAKRNLERGVPEEDAVPDYFVSEGGIRSPFEWKGSRMYLLPDLPFLNLQDTAEIGNMAGMVSPIIRTPFEVWTGKQMWNNMELRDDMQVAPESWNWLMPILSLASGAPGMPEVKRHNGQWVLREKDAYALESAMPLLGRARRLMPSEKRYQDRLFTSVMSTVFGFGARTNTEYQRAGAIRAREFAIRDAERKSRQLEKITSET